MAGQKDLAKLFKRVTALEQGDDESEQDVARILKSYADIGIKITIRTRFKQHLICGDNSPLAGAITSPSTYI